jgi:hypothetical protein
MPQKGAIHPIIASAAKQASFSGGKDCFVALLLATTAMEPPLS